MRQSRALCATFMELTRSQVQLARRDKVSHQLQTLGRHSQNSSTLNMTKKEAYFYTKICIHRRRNRTMCQWEQVLGTEATVICKFKWWTLINLQPATIPEVHESRTASKAKVVSQKKSSHSITTRRSTRKLYLIRTSSKYCTILSSSNTNRVTRILTLGKINFTEELHPRS